MQYRCTGGFTVGDRTVSGGQLVDDSDPIVASHPQCFAAVGEPSAPAGETASTDAPRRPGRPKKVAVAPEAPESDDRANDAGTGV